MKADSHLLEFIEAAKNQGASDEFLAGLLQAQGWKEEAVYQALGAHYEKLTGLQIPRRKRGGAAAKDAFLYLLAFSTLATWAIALGSLMFTLIDEWIADPVSPNQFSGQNFDNYTIASSIASMVVAFPIYFLVMWFIQREVRKDPEKLESSVRKWLSYIALLIAAGVVIGGLVTVVTYFLRGEITLRFITKAAVAIVISGGVFWYYLVSLKAPAQEAASAVPRQLHMDNTYDRGSGGRSGTRLHQPRWPFGSAAGAGGRQANYILGSTGCESERVLGDIGPHATRGDKGWGNVYRSCYSPAL